MIRFSNLRVLQRSHQLSLLIYRTTERFPTSERFGLRSQIRRAATSVPINLAEGSKCESPDEFVRFINIAERSNAEVQYEVMLCRDLGYLAEADYQHIRREAGGIARQLHSLKETVRKSRFIA